MLRLFAAVFMLVAAASCAVNAYCAGAEYRSDAEESIYAYTENDMPEVFFFPKEKARWDGTRVTMREWYMLSDLQKEKFVSEYIGQMKAQYQEAVEATGLDYLKALDLFSYYSNEKARNEPSTKFIDLILEGQGRSGVSPKK